MNTRLHALSCCFLLGLIFGSCASIPFDRPKEYSEAFTDTEDTLLGEAAARWTEGHENVTVFFPLEQGMDALGVRLRLADLAEKSIDLQYFLMKDDTAGAVMTEALLKAADRGVRVRFLLDDIFTTVKDKSLLLMNGHPNVEVRLFNPISRRGWRFLNFVGHFEQANRRMHNKSFTVDNQATVVGGRNIADEYFQLDESSLFSDFDVLAIGPIAREVSESFDLYWNHSRAVPMEYVAGSRGGENARKARERSQEQLEEVYTSIYRKAVESRLLQDLFAERQRLFPATARVIADSPDKIIDHLDKSTDPASREQSWLVAELRQILLEAEEEVIFLSPYFVPGNNGVEFLRGLMNKGVRVIIVTNSLASTNHIPVHSAYAGYREPVIEAGAELYEVRADAAHEVLDSDDGPDTLTLHTKALVIDRRHLLIGSLNFDPRSIEINAEMLLVIDSSEMVESLTADMDERLARRTYRVMLDEDQDLYWHGTVDGEQVIETSEPLSSLWRCFKAWLMKIVPESQL